MDTITELVEKIVKGKHEEQTIEVKAALKGTPRIYDTLSSFSNQQEGGRIVFGIDEGAGFAVTGVGNVQALQKDVVDQGKEMTPEIRPTFRVGEYEGKPIVVAYIAGLPMRQRPAYRTTSGVGKGSFVRSGDQDLHMTPVELYEIEAFKDGARDDLSVPAYSGCAMLDDARVSGLVLGAKEDRPYMARRQPEEVLTLMGAVRDGKPTLAGLMALSDYPQQAYPNLCVTAIAVAGTEIRQDEEGGRFLDNKRFEGPISEMLEDAVAFVRRNTKMRVSVVDGRRVDSPEYPENAVREILTNALMHRDYGPYSNGTPVRLAIFSNRLECSNPGGIYGGQSVEDLGRTNVQTRNPTLVSLLEIQGVAENRHSGIPTIRDEMSKAGLRPPVFIDRRGFFTAVLYNEPEGQGSEGESRRGRMSKEAILEFCNVPRSREEVAERFGSSVAYVSGAYLNPMVNDGALRRTNPDHPRARDQRYVAVR